ncbi:MAG TPA: hypothetical protein PK020_20015 [Ilumatobacteraceae bacterium]|nr:hypothetical protein [Ilumatobacteraceae bacterium]HQZ87070.1 hypothetical protein [Actinomycetota bacterium]
MRRVTVNRERGLADRPARDSGFGLVETVVAITLMGIAVIPIMVAGIVSVRASAQTRTAAKVETVLGNAADRINRAAEGCDYHVYVEAAALSEGWATSQAVATYQWYQPAASPVTLGTWQAGACPGGVRPEHLVQKVTITVISPDGNLQRTIQVVKSDV